jgi:cysteinylglycine-S-conjugate dipeptidase
VRPLRFIKGKKNAMSEKYLEDWDSYIEDLKALTRIPSVSFSGFPRVEVERSADAVAQLMEKRGLENVEVIRPNKEVHPYVYGDWLHAPGKPTLLLYAHHDVQPPGREEIWNTKPFDPVEKEGPGGRRLYARGSADDKAGIIVHLAAIGDLLRKNKALPLNVKVIIEGEEEIGSGNLFHFLEQNKEKLQSDILVLTDTDNYDCGLPGLTTSLRGMVVVNIELRSIKNTLHSGMWGGPVPDPVMALSKVLAGLVGDDGQISVPSIRGLVKELTIDERKTYDALPYKEEEFRKQCGLVDSAMLLPPFEKGGPTPPVQTWRYPSLTINAIQASERNRAGNIICDTAWARVSIRVPPKMDAKKTENFLIQHLRETVPWGLEVKTDSEVSVDGWMTDAKGPAFEAAERAMKKGFGCDVLKTGCGGTIPFVEPFAKALGGAPALLIGVEDPYTNAHGENESLLLSDLYKVALSEIYLFQDLAENYWN